MINTFGPTFGKTFGTVFGDPFLPTDEPHLRAWFDKGVGVTVTGPGVSQWDDQSGDDLHLLQPIATNRPIYNAATGEITGDGINDFLATLATTLIQPITIYILFKQNTWINLNRIIDGFAPSSGSLAQRGISPELEINAGGGFTATNNQLPLNTYGICTVIFNGASSSIRINDNTPITGNAGTANMGGATMFAIGGGGNRESDCTVLSMIMYDTLTQTEPTQAQLRYFLGTRKLN